MNEILFSRFGGGQHQEEVRVQQKGQEHPEEADSQEADRQETNSPEAESPETDSPEPGSQEADSHKADSPEDCAEEAETLDVLN